MSNLALASYPREVIQQMAPEIPVARHVPMSLIKPAAIDTRANRSESLIDDYVNAFDSLPPIVLRGHDRRFEIIDGGYRYLAAKRLGKHTIYAHVWHINARAAVWFAARMNSKVSAPGMGAVWSYADRQAFVRAVIASGMVEGFSARSIGEVTNVTHPTVMHVLKTAERAPVIDADRRVLKTAIATQSGEAIGVRMQMEPMPLLGLEIGGRWVMLSPEQVGDAARVLMAAGRSMKSAPSNAKATDD